MKTTYLRTVFLAACTLHAGLTFAQGQRKTYDLDKNDSMKNVFFDGRKAFLDERLHQQFPALGVCKTIDNKVYDFNQTGRATIIQFGISNCAPCRVQLPYFIELSNDSRYADIDFLYISYDDSATIMKDIANLYHGPHDRLKIISLERDYFTYSDKPMLSYGFPTMYFMDKSRMVKAITIGGSLDETNKVLKSKWSSLMELLSYNN
jgi:thiol-disulfide isomerase/thioredoxin